MSDENFEGGEVTTTSSSETADRIVRNHVLWAMGAGLMPIPLMDLAGVTAIQMDALKQLAKHHGVEYTEATGKRFVTALAGGAVARLGASMLKMVPLVGTALGGVSMSAMSGASTYAVCQVARNHFETHGNFLELDLEDAKSAYRKALEKGKEIVEALKPDEEAAVNVQAELERLETERAAGDVSDGDYESRKAALLAKLNPDGDA